MNINAIGFGQATAPDGTQAPGSEKPTGFAQALGVAQSGAPPGPPTPTTGAKVGEEVATKGPNAPSLNPDLLLPIQATAETAVQPTIDSGRKIGASAATDLDPTVLAMAAASLNFGSVANPTADAQFINPTASAPSPSLGSVGSNPVSDPLPMPPTLLPSPDIAGAQGNVAFMEPTAAAEPPAASELVTKISPDAVGNTPAKVPPPTVNGKAIPPPDLNGGGPIPGSDSSLTPATAAVVVTPTASAQAGQQGATANEQVNPTAKPDAPPPTAGMRTAKKSEARGATVGPHLDVDDVSADAKAVKVAAKASDFDSDGDFSNGKPVRDPLISVVAPKASDSVTPSGDKPALKASDLNLVVRQITDRMELLAATRPKNGVTIMLQPEHLGSVTMTVKSAGSGIEAHISASDDNVRTALEQNRAMLGQSLADRGLKLDAVSIAAQTRDSTTAQHQASQQQQQQSQARQAQQQAAPHFGSAHQGLTAQQARQTVRSYDGVDLWI